MYLFVVIETKGEANEGKPMEKRLKCVCNNDNGSCGSDWIRRYKKKRSLQEHDSMHPDWSTMVKLCIDAVRNPTYKSASTTGARFEGPYKWIFYVCAFYRLPTTGGVFLVT